MKDSYVVSGFDLCLDLIDLFKLLCQTKIVI